jgi:uncharacterized protein YdiU (UPF0061 family)
MQIDVTKMLQSGMTVEDITREVIKEQQKIEAEKLAKKSVDLDKKRTIAATAVIEYINELTGKKRTPAELKELVEDSIDILKEMEQEITPMLSFLQVLEQGDKKKSENSNSTCQRGRYNSSTNAKVSDADALKKWLMDL